MNNPYTDLSSLTPDSTLLFFLRTLFSTAAEYGVYIPDTGDAVVINKGQLISMIERNCAEAMIKRLPQLAQRNIFKPLDVEKIDELEIEDSLALYVKNTGSFIGNLELALNPDATQFPEWWNAPVPFAMSSRGVLKLNDKAVSMFGTGLEKLNAAELPDRDEFIVRLDGLNGTRFIAFRFLSPGIFTIDDCTEDLTDAQDITWWAAVGRTWVKEIESRGGTWQRLSNPPEGKSKNFRVCEWNDEIQGYLNIEMPKKKIKSDEFGVKNKKKNTPAKPKIEEIKEEEKKGNTESEIKENPDDVIGHIGPQAMALLASGQPREGTSFLI
ncbi:MAG: hypothetical protein IJ859_02315 [Synergistaceae bacterium]|nr:hypothetical protein [Synergistaceae bacterium]